MAVIVTSKAAARRHGVYGLEAAQPATITATGTGNVVLVDTYSWGPEQILTYPSDPTTLVNMLAPPGTSRTTLAYLSLIRKAYARMGFVRVVASDAVKASCTVNKSGPTAVFNVVARYKGVLGNSFSLVIGPATDGVSTHFDMTVTLSGLSGTTTDIIRNCDNASAGLMSTIDLSKAYLIGSITETATGRPINGTYTFSAGTDGTVASSDWVGTAGTADKGIALLEGDPTVDFVVPGDAGSNRAAVNAGAQAHADSMTDRMAIIHGPAAQTAAQAQTDVASYRSIRVIYVDPWCYIFDENGAKQLVPASHFAASVASQLPPSTSIAWKGETVQKMLAQIKGLEAARGANAADNTDAGIVTLIQETSGGYTFESAKNAYNPTDPRKGTIKRTRMGHFLARSVIDSLRPYVDSPNVAENQDDEREAVDEFLSQLVKNSKDKNVNLLTHIAAYDIAESTSVNSQQSIDAGEYTIGVDVKISSDQEKIFLSMSYGENVNPVASAQ